MQVLTSLFPSKHESDALAVTSESKTGGEGETFIGFFTAEDVKNPQIDPTSEVLAALTDDLVPQKNVEQFAAALSDQTAPASSSEPKDQLVGDTIATAADEQIQQSETSTIRTHLPNVDHLETSPNPPQPDHLMAAISKTVQSSITNQENDQGPVILEDGSTHLMEHKNFGEIPTTEQDFPVVVPTAPGEPMVVEQIIQSPGNSLAISEQNQAVPEKLEIQPIAPIKINNFKAQQNPSALEVKPETSALTISPPSVRTQRDSDGEVKSATSPTQPFKSGDLIPADAVRSSANVQSNEPSKAPSTDQYIQSIPTEPKPAGTNNPIPSQPIPLGENTLLDAIQKLEAVEIAQQRELSGLQRLQEVQLGSNTRPNSISSLIEQSRPETIVSRVASSLEATIARGINGSYELKLHPIELGTVRIVMSHSETGMTAVVSAERPEVLDLLRRNGDSLLNDLRNSAEGNVQMSFQNESGTGQKKSQPQQSYVISDGLGVSEDQTSRSRHIIDHGLDIRL